ncbi:MAG: MotA/TolQ/ExbB proton channel family protein [Rhodospirillales bacterium]
MQKTTAAVTDGTPPEIAQMDPLADPLTDPWYALIAEAWDLLVLGGPVVAILITMSVVAVAITVVKVWQFWSMRASRLNNVRRAVQLKRLDKPLEALACVQGDRNPVAQTLAIALRGRIRGDLDDTEIRTEAERFGSSQIEAMRTYLRPLEVIASLAPLLGLFGTVLGMITAFQQMEAAGNQVNPSVLSGGIWEALLTTAVGLAVAIPTVAILNWLERTTERTEAAMADAVAHVFTRDLSRLPAHATADAGRTTGRIGAD